MIDFLDDLEADFLRFYRIEDITRLDGPRFFRLAWRVSAYGGVMQMRLEAQDQRQAPSDAAPRPSATRHPHASPAQSGRREVSNEAFMFMFGGDIERVTVPKGDASV